MENNKQSGGGNGFLAGLILGVVIGAAIVFFLFTKKGKDIIKTITDEGLDKISDLESILEDASEDILDTENISEDNGEVKVSGKTKPIHVVHHVSGQAKRFFRKSS